MTFFFSLRPILKSFWIPLMNLDQGKDFCLHLTNFTLPQHHSTSLRLEEEFLSTEILHFLPKRFWSHQFRTFFQLLFLCFDLTNFRLDLMQFRDLPRQH